MPKTSTPGNDQELFGKHNPIRDLPNWCAAIQQVPCSRSPTIEPNTVALVHDYSPTRWAHGSSVIFTRLFQAAPAKNVRCSDPRLRREFILDRRTLFDPAMTEFGWRRPGYRDRLLQMRRLEPGRSIQDDRPRPASSGTLSAQEFLAAAVDAVRRRSRDEDDGARAASDTACTGLIEPVCGCDPRFGCCYAALKERGIPAN